ncbi:MAG: hypothetical protein ACO22B_11055, partial [Ilumatobacteraceae bacterium]
ADPRTGFGVGSRAPKAVDGANPEKVLLAAVLLGVGDVDVALSEGLVTVDEVDLAAAALATGTLAEWADRANAGS